MTSDERYALRFVEHVASETPCTISSTGENWASRSYLLGMIGMAHNFAGPELRYRLLAIARRYGW